MIEMPLFSIIIPAYNAEEFIINSISSVISQSYTDYECIVVDDGSTDDTGKLVSNYLSSKLKIVSQANSGLLIARREGLKHAVGRYVLFLDADDALRSDALAIIAQDISNNKSDIVAFGYSNEINFSKPKYCPDLPTGFYHECSYSKVISAVFRGRFNSLWSKAISLSLFDSDFDYLTYKGLMHGEDLFQLLPVLNNATSFSYIKTPLYFYRRHKGSSTMSYKPSQLDDINNVCRRVLEYGKKWNLVNESSYCAIFQLISTVMLLLSDDQVSDIAPGEFNRAASLFDSYGFDSIFRNVGLRLDYRFIAEMMVTRNYKAAELAVRSENLIRHFPIH